MNFSNQKKIYELSKAIETLCILRGELNKDECQLVREAAQEIQQIMGDWRIISIDKALDNQISKMAPSLQAQHTIIKKRNFRFKVYARPKITSDILFNILQQLMSSKKINIHLITESREPHIVILVFEAVTQRKPDFSLVKKLCEENQWTMTFTYSSNIGLATIRLRIIG